MNEEENNKKTVVQNYVNKNSEVPHIGFLKKIWYSITKFERYPEMASEGVRKAITYLVQFMIIFSIILAAVMTYKFTGLLQEGTEYMENNFEVLSYENGNLDIKLKDDQNKIITDVGALIIDTGDVQQTQIEQYEKEVSSNDIGIIWLKDKVIVKMADAKEQFYYKDILDQIEITSFDKASLIEYITGTNKIKIAITYFVTMIIYSFIIYFLAQLMNALLLSIFGVITSWVAKMKIRYRAIFNMSIYAITLPTILQLIYMVVNYFIDFDIKYFDLMYTAISYICLAAAIFMIKSDVIKQQVELMKIMNEEQQKGQEEEKKQDEENQKEEKDGKEDKDEKREKKNDKKEEEDLGGQIEGEGSKA